MPRISRLSPNEIQTDLSESQALEVCGHVLTQSGVRDVVIDTRKCIVAGDTRKSLIAYNYRISARVEKQLDATIITIHSQLLPYGFEFGTSWQRSKYLSEILESTIRDEAWGRFATQKEVTLPPVAQVPPIAAPTAPATLPDLPRLPREANAPQYGTALPLKRGLSVFTWALSSICCGLMGPVAIAYGIKTLKDYEQENPGDKALVIAGIVMAALTSLFWASRILTN